MAAPSIIQFRDYDLQRLTQTEFGTRAAMRFAQQFPLNYAIKNKMVNVIGRSIKANTPVATIRTYDHIHLRDSIRAQIFGDRIQWYWNSYGKYLVRGTTAHAISPRNYPFLAIHNDFGGVNYVNKSVNVKGIEPRPFVQKAIRDAQIDILAIMKAYGLGTFRLIRDPYAQPEDWVAALPEEWR